MFVNSARNNLFLTPAYSKTGKCFPLKNREIKKVNNTAFTIKSDS